MLEEKGGNLLSESEIDLSYLNDIAGGSIEFMIEMIDLFLEQTPTYFEQLEEAITEKDWRNIAAVAHKIKPTLAFMGMNTAKQGMEAIEYKARAMENMDFILTEFDKLKTGSVILFTSLQQAKADLATKL